MTRSAAIIIPALNCAATIGKTIDSALAQDWDGELEVLVIDNGSSDDTRELAAARSVTVVSELRRGRSIARNTGAARSAGQILAFMDADCEVPTRWLRDAAELLEQVPWVGAVQARIRKRDDVLPAEDSIHARWYLPFLDTCALVTTRRNFANARGFDEMLPRNVDMDFSFRLLACGYALGLLPDAVAIKHHDLNVRDVLRRGWDGGTSVAQVDKKWRHLVPRTPTRLLGALQAWAQRLTKARTSPHPGLEAIEQSAQLLGYGAGVLTRVHRTEYEPLTPLAKILGGARSLAVTPSGGFIYDRRVNARVCLTRAELGALEELAGGHYFSRHGVEDRDRVRLNEALS